MPLGTDLSTRESDAKKKRPSLLVDYSRGKASITDRLDTTEGRDFSEKFVVVGKNLGCPTTRHSITTLRNTQRPNLTRSLTDPEAQEPKKPRPSIKFTMRRNSERSLGSESSYRNLLKANSIRDLGEFLAQSDSSEDERTRSPTTVRDIQSTFGSDELKPSSPGSYSRQTSRRRLMSRRANSLANLLESIPFQEPSHNLKVEHCLVKKDNRPSFSRSQSTSTLLGTSIVTSTQRRRHKKKGSSQLDMNGLNHSQSSLLSLSKLSEQNRSHRSLMSRQRSTRSTASILESLPFEGNMESGKEESQPAKESQRPRPNFKRSTSTSVLLGDSNGKANQRRQRRRKRTSLVVDARNGLNQSWSHQLSSSFSQLDTFQDSSAFVTATRIRRHVNVE